MLEFMKPLDELPEFREQSVINSDIVDITARSGWEDLTMGEIRAIDLKFEDPEREWKDCFIKVGYGLTAARALSTLIVNKPGFAEYKTHVMDNIKAGVDVHIIQDMAIKAMATDQDTHLWDTKDPIKTKFDIQKYFLENVSKDPKKEDSVKNNIVNVFIAMNQNNSKTRMSGV